MCGEPRKVICWTSARQQEITSRERAKGIEPAPRELIGKVMERTTGDATSVIMLKAIRRSNRTILR